MVERMPAEVYPPGLLVQEEMTERGWDVARMTEAAGLELTAADIERVLSGTAPLTTVDMMGIAKAFGTSVQFWFNLDWRYWRWLQDVADAVNAPKEG